MGYSFENQIFMIDISRIDSPTPLGKYVFSEKVNDFRIQSPFIYVLTDTSIHEFDINLNQTIHVVLNEDFIGRKLVMTKEGGIAVYKPFPIIQNMFWTYHVKQGFPSINGMC